MYMHLLASKELNMYTWYQPLVRSGNFFKWPSNFGTARCLYGQIWYSKLLELSHMRNSGTKYLELEILLEHKSWFFKSS